MIPLKNIFVLLAAGWLMGNTACASFVEGAAGSYSKHKKDERRKETAVSSVFGSDSDFNPLEVASACIEKVENKPQHSYVMTKSPNEPTFKHLSDSSYVTVLEKKLLANYITEIEQCYSPNTYKGSTPAMTQFYAIADEGWNNIIISLARLYNGEITWGQANTEGQRIYNETIQKGATWQDNVSTRIQSDYDKQILMDEISNARNQRQQMIRELRSAREEISNLNRQVYYNNLGIYY
jgi:hypothetical protein